MEDKAEIEMSMGMQLPDDLPFDRWINYVFDHPANELEWWWDVEVQQWDYEENSPLALSHMTRLFRDPAFLIDRFNRVQIDRGLNYLVSNYMFVLRESATAWSTRRACFDAMIDLYRKLMAPVYGNDLAAGTTKVEPDRPTFACYMWWDVIPLYGAMGDRDQALITDAVFYIFEEVLKLESEACLESVLHGLGHWHLYERTRVEPLVKGFLHRTDISPSLRRYAQAAAKGAVL